MSSPYLSIATAAEETRSQQNDNYVGPAIFVVFIARRSADLLDRHWDKIDEASRTRLPVETSSVPGYGLLHWIAKGAFSENCDRAYFGEPP